MTFNLKYTGTYDQSEFEQRCAEHDFWYHSFYFDNGFQIRGDYDIGIDIQDYHFPEDMHGMTVLDLGTGSGWFATYFEQAGATVTTVDVRGYSDFDVYGRHTLPDISTEKTQPDRISDSGEPLYYSPVSRGFWIIKDILGLQAEYRNSRVYDLCPDLFEGRKFDLVFMGSLLMHLRDPVGALMAARSVCNDRLIANSLVPPRNIQEDYPVMEFINNPQDKVNWWRPNRLCLNGLAHAAGFENVSVENNVNITTDKPYVHPETGQSSGVTQELYLLDARI